MIIKRFDHLVIPVCNMEKSIDFYRRLGFKPIKSETGYDLKGPSFLLKLHLLDTTATPVAKNVTVGCIDICFEINISQSKLQKYLENNNIKVELAMVPRKGYKGRMISTYVRDPDGNLIELSTYY